MEKELKKKLKKKNNMAYNMKNSPINKGYAAKPSPVKWAPLVALLGKMGVSATAAAKIGAVATKVGTVAKNIGTTVAASVGKEGALTKAASSKAGQAAISGATGLLISKATTPPKDAPEEAGDFSKIHLGYPQEIK